MTGTNSLLISLAALAVLLGIGWSMNRVLPRSIKWILLFLILLASAGALGSLTILLGIDQSAIADVLALGSTVGAAAFAYEKFFGGSPIETFGGGKSTGHGGRFVKFLGVSFAVILVGDSLVIAWELSIREGIGLFEAGLLMFLLVWGSSKGLSVREWFRTYTALVLIVVVALIVISAVTASLPLDVAVRQLL